MFTTNPHLRNALAIQKDISEKGWTGKKGRMFLSTIDRAKKHRGRGGW